MRRSTSVRTLRLLPALLLFAGSVSAPAPAGAEVIRRVVGGSEYLGQQLALSGNGRFLLRLEESGGTVCNTVRFPTVRVFHRYDNGALGEMSAFYACDAAFAAGVFVAAPR